MTTVRLVQALTPNADSAAVTACVNLAEAEFMAACNRDDVPEEAQHVIVRIAQRLYGRIGAEALSAQSYSGSSETFSDDWPEDLKRAVYRYRKLVAL